MRSAGLHTEEKEVFDGNTENLHADSISRSVHEDITRSTRIRQNDANFHKTIFIQAGRSLKWQFDACFTPDTWGCKINISLRACIKIWGKFNMNLIQLSGHKIIFGVKFSMKNFLMRRFALRLETKYLSAVWKERKKIKKASPKKKNNSPSRNFCHFLKLIHDRSE